MINKKILGLLGLATRAGKTIFGTESVTQAIQKKQVRLVIVAKDAAERTKKNIEKLCQENQIEQRVWASNSELSQAIGQVNKAIIGIKDQNFSNEIIKLIDGGDIIG